jgi:cell division protease FtsH
MLMMPGGRERRYSDETAHAIDQAVQRIVERAFERTLELLRRQRPVLERGAVQLLQKETLDEADLRALVSDAPTPLAAQ